VEARGLRSDFERSGVDLLFVKGLTTGALAYPKPLLKMGWDLDLLIDPEQLGEAVELLLARGYCQVTPSDPADIFAWHRRSKESVWSRSEDVYVELHTQLADNRRLIPGIDVHSPRREVEITAGVALPTLGHDELFAYLCVHGASSAWFRLKWITDVAALLSHVDVTEIERLYRRSQELGAGRAPAQALLLADGLYESLQGSPLAHELSRDRISAWLAASALRQIAGRAEPREPTEAFLGTSRIHYTQLALLPGLRFALSEAFRQLRAATA